MNLNKHHHHQSITEINWAWSRT